MRCLDSSVTHSAVQRRAGRKHIGGADDLFAVNADGVYGVNHGGTFHWTPALIGDAWPHIGPTTTVLATD
jgi:hypothetical protein